jgi:hypothetical protein
MGAWWTRAQEVPEDALSEELGTSVRTRSGDAPRKRRRRRRGRKEAGGKAE